MTDQSEFNIWQVDVYPREGEIDRLAERVIGDAIDLDLISQDDFKISSARGFLIQGQLEQETVDKIARKLLVENVVEGYQVGQVGEQHLSTPPNGKPTLIYVLPKPGVTDTEAENTANAIEYLGESVDAVRTFRKYWVNIEDPAQAHELARRLLANESIEQVVLGPLNISRLDMGREYKFEIQHADLRAANDEQLMQISRDWVLSLTLPEMHTIQKHYQDLGRDPTDIELETIAQTWSEHCSHKTLAGRIEYRDERGVRTFDNMLQETIFAATQTIRKNLGDDDWCVSVFKDNAGIIKFDDSNNLTFKVETHNRPSAIEPYGGASTGIGGVIRDTLGTGLGAKPICNTDVFCFANPDLSSDQLPPGVMHPRRIMKGVVEGVRDYGNRMGIPTVNGAIYFDDRYIGNPLVFCGNVGLIPDQYSFKEPQDGDLIVAIGGKTGRDGIHGATFSSAELTEKSEQISSGAVQIGDPVTEKTVLDVLLMARDRNLYNAVTDCGAGGFSSAVGEMGEELGAVVDLEKAPLKYDGLSYTEIWISEAQERMVFSVPESKWSEFEQLCNDEGVDVTTIGKFEATGKLCLRYQGTTVGELEMSFLHDGRPAVVRKASFEPPQPQQLANCDDSNLNDDVLGLLSSLNIASKHWVIRQYDHEVLARSVVKPLVGAENDGPGDAAVVRPLLDSYRGAAISCGMNPYYGDIDPYHMAASGIDEAVRNCVAVGADPNRIAILDNFCWGFTDREETLGSLVRAALACQDIAVAYKTPFISGKDSLNNEFSYTAENGERETIKIPSTLLISAIGQIDDVRKCQTMDFKAAGNLLYLVGKTYDEMGGSHFAHRQGLTGGNVPEVRTDDARQLFETVHQAFAGRLIRACHDLCEGGLAVAVAEMAIAGRIGCEIDLDRVALENNQGTNPRIAKLFSESNSRFVVEIAPEHQDDFESTLSGVAFTQIGNTTTDNRVAICEGGEQVIQLSVEDLRVAWQSPLDWGNSLG